MNKSRVVSTTEVRMEKILQDGTRIPLGLVSAAYKNPLRQAWWRLVGKPRANRRIARENARSASAHR